MDLQINDKRLLLDRYLLTKVAAFPDCYERLALNHIENNNSTSALVTCERMIALFSSWARPMHFHSKMLHRLGNRPLEVKESATAAMGMPLWTLATDQEDLEKAVGFAGYSSLSAVGSMHSFRASDPRTNDLGEGVDPMQIPLDQAAHLMDAVTLGSFEGGWDGARSLLAEKYRLGGYPAMADFIMAVDDEDEEMGRNNRELAQEQKRASTSASSGTSTGGIAEVTLPESFKLKNIAATVQATEKFKHVDYLAEQQKKRSRQESGYYQRFHHENNNATALTSSFMLGATAELGLDDNELLDVTAFTAIASAATPMSAHNSTTVTATAQHSSNLKSSDDQALNKYKKQQGFRR
eukprot:gene21408-27438_t